MQHRLQPFIRWSPTAGLLQHNRRFRIFGTDWTSWAYYEFATHTSLRRALRSYLVHYHRERNHQGKGNILLFPSSQEPSSSRHQPVCCQERLGGLLKYYNRQAA